MSVSVCDFLEFIDLTCGYIVKASHNIHPHSSEPSVQYMVRSAVAISKNREGCRPLRYSYSSLLSAT